MKKKVLAIILAVMMLASMATLLVPVSAEETTDTTEKVVCGHYNATWTGGNGTDNKVMTCPDCNFTMTFKPSATLPKGGEEATDGVQAVYLTANIEVTKKTPAANDTTYYIDLNGKTITTTAAAPVFVLNTGIVYHMFDLSTAKSGKLLNTAAKADKNAFKTRTSAIVADSGNYYGGGASEFNMYGGTIADFQDSAHTGGAFGLEGVTRAENETPDSITVNMFAGTISNCQGWQGGAVWCSLGAKFNMYGGTITGCKSFSWGKAAQVSAAIMAHKNGQVTIYDGTFSANIDHSITTGFIDMNVATSTGATLEVKGGKFDKEIPADYVAAGFEVASEGTNFVVRQETKEEVVGSVTHHIVTMDNKVDATCTEDGHESDWKCLDKHDGTTACDYVKKGATIEKKGHTEEKIAKVEPVCGKEGATEGKKCSECNEVLQAPTAIAALEHKLGEWKVFEAATADKAGEERQKCDLCGKTINKREIPATSTQTDAATDAAPAEEKSGCGSMIGTGVIALVATLGLGVTAVSKKRNG